MRTEFGNNPFRKLCQFLSGHSNNLFFSKLVFPILTTLPVVLIIPIVRSNDATQNSQTTSELWKMASGLIADNILIAVLIAYLYRIISKLLLELIRQYGKAEYSLDKTDIIYLSKALSPVMEAKKRRFTDYVIANKSKQNINAYEAFSKLAHPLDQIRLLTLAILSVLTYIDEKYKDNNANFRVGLLGIKDGQPHEWLEYAGGSGSPSLSPEQLSSPNSGVMVAIQTKNPVYINNLEKNWKSAQNTNSKNSDEPLSRAKGSLVCYPVKYAYTNDVPYVITVRSEECNRFKPQDLYNWAFEFYVKRMIVEHSLLVLKEKITDER